MNRGPFILGLTGRVGVGKSFAASCLHTQLKAHIVDLDVIGHRLLGLSRVRNEIKTCFGAELVLPTGEVDRKRLGQLVFNLASPLPLAQLNAILHPLILKKAIQEAESYSSGLIVIVGALLDEIGLRVFCDSILVIDAEDRAIMSKNRDKFLKISPFQKSRKAFLDSADHVVLNSFSSSFCPTLIQLICDKVAPDAHFN